MEPHRRLNKYRDSVLTVSDAVDLLLSGKSLGGVFTDEEEIELFNRSSKTVQLKLNDETVSIEEDTLRRTQHWNIPPEYLSIDVKQYLLDRCSTDEERARVLMEYDMFASRNLIIVLQFFIFLVDHFRNNKIIWGVGRGSSVASYILYIIGVHRINSIRYNLDITEFLKE